MNAFEQVFGRFWEARSVGEFWRLWNPGLRSAVLMAFRWLRRRCRFPGATVAVLFVIYVLNGLYHDACTCLVSGHTFRFSFTSSFVVNGAVVLVERKLPFRVPLPDPVKRVLTLSWIPFSFWAVPTLLYG